MPMQYKIISATGRNGLGCPFGVETSFAARFDLLSGSVGMAWDARSGLKHTMILSVPARFTGRNGLGCPFGFETLVAIGKSGLSAPSEWPGMPVRV